MSESTSDQRPIEEEMQLRRLQQDYQGKAHRDVITARLAFVLIIIMCVTLIAHYITVAFFAAPTS